MSLYILLGSFLGRRRGKGELLPIGSIPEVKLVSYYSSPRLCWRWKNNQALYVQELGLAVQEELTFGIIPNITRPKAALRIDMTTSEANAPPKTVIRACRVAIIAAIRNVLSPITSPISFSSTWLVFVQLTNLGDDNHDKRLKQDIWAAFLSTNTIQHVLCSG
jgi:hypothetical protein